MDATDKLPQHSRWSFVTIACITLAGLALRLTNIGESLWLDELHTGWVVKDAWSDVAWRAQIGNQSPLWFYAVKVVTTLGGESELTLRLLSLLAGTALIPATYWLVYLLVPKESSGSPLACGLAASLIAVDPNCIFYATEARPYACLQLCAALQLGLFWQILHAPTTKLRLAWILLTALAFHLHYTGILILLGELVVLLGYYLLTRKPVPYRPWRAAFDWQIAVMLCLPAIGHVLEVGQRREMWDSMSQLPQWSSLLTVFPLYPAFTLGAIVYVLTLVHRHCGGATAKPQADGAALAVMALWLCVPLLAAFAATHADLARIFLRRYLIAFALGPPLLTALLLTRVPRPAWQWFAAAAVLGFAVYDSNIVPQLRYDGRTIPSRGEDWRGAIAWLRQQYQGRPHPVIVDAKLVEDGVGRTRISSDESNWDERERRWERQTRLQIEYRSFPLQSLYPPGVPADQLVPKSLILDWFLVRLDRLDPNRGYWRITRGNGSVPETLTERRDFEGIVAGLDPIKSND